MLPHTPQLEVDYLPLFHSHYGLGTTIWSPLASGQSLPPPPPILPSASRSRCLCTGMLVRVCCRIQSYLIQIGRDTSLQGWSTFLARAPILVQDVKLCMYELLCACSIWSWLEEPCSSKWIGAGLLTGKYSKDHIPEGSRFALGKYNFIKERSIVDDKLEKVEKLKAVADELGATLPQLAIAWTLKNPNVSVVLLGATKEAQVRASLMFATM